MHEEWQGHLYMYSIYLQSQKKLYSLFDSFCPYNIAKNLEPMSNEQENC